MSYLKKAGQYAAITALAFASVGCSKKTEHISSAGLEKRLESQPACSSLEDRAHVADADSSDSSSQQNKEQPYFSEQIRRDPEGRLTYEQVFKGSRFMIDMMKKSLEQEGQLDDMIIKGYSYVKEDEAAIISYVFEENRYLFRVTAKNKTMEDKIPGLVKDDRK